VTSRPDDRLAPANLSDLAVAEEFLAGVAGWVLADRNYGSPRLAEQLAAQGGGCWPAQGRRPPAAAAAAVAGRQAPTGGDGDRADGRALPPEAGLGTRCLAPWSRWQRKLLSHTLAVYLCQQAGLGSLRFADLITSQTRKLG
jgi:hypothetical protein